MAIEPALLHEHVEGLANGGATDVEARAERVLRCDSLPLSAQIAPDGVGDLKVAGGARTVIHVQRLPSQDCLDTYHPAREESTTPWTMPEPIRPHPITPTPWTAMDPPEITKPAASGRPAPAKRPATCGRAAGGAAKADRDALRADRDS